MAHESQHVGLQLKGSKLHATPVSVKGEIMKDTLAVQAEEGSFLVVDNRVTILDKASQTLRIVDFSQSILEKEPIGLKDVLPAGVTVTRIVDADHLGVLVEGKSDFFLVKLAPQGGKIELLEALPKSKTVGFLSEDHCVKVTVSVDFSSFFSSLFFLPIKPPSPQKEHRH